jgi:hypothetical protein
MILAIRKEDLKRRELPPVDTLSPDRKKPDLTSDRILEMVF